LFIKPFTVAPEPCFSEEAEEEQEEEEEEEDEDEEEEGGRSIREGLAEKQGRKSL